MGLGTEYERLDMPSGKSLFETLPTVEKESEESYSDTEVSLTVDDYNVETSTLYTFRARRPSLLQWLRKKDIPIDVTVVKHERVLDEDQFSFLPTAPRTIKAEDWKPEYTLTVAGGSPETDSEKFESILAARIPESPKQIGTWHLSPNDQGNVMARMLKERTPPASEELIQRLKKLPKRQKIEFILPQGKHLTHEQKSIIERFIKSIVSGKLTPTTK